MWGLGGGSETTAVRRLLYRGTLRGAYGYTLLHRRAAGDERGGGAAGRRNDEPSLPPETTRSEADPPRLHCNPPKMHRPVSRSAAARPPRPISALPADCAKKSERLRLVLDAQKMTLLSSSFLSLSSSPRHDRFTPSDVDANSTTVHRLAQRRAVPSSTRRWVNHRVVAVPCRPGRFNVADTAAVNTGEQLRARPRNSGVA